MKNRTDLSATEPRYRVIAQKLLRDIQTGQLVVGDLLASEAQLSQKFNASRGTIRQSLSVLKDAGLIVRRKRSGTRILSKFPARGLVDSEQILDDWARYGIEFPLRISSVIRRTLPPDLLALAPRISGGSWLAVTGLRYPIGSREPISYCQAFIHPKYAGVAADLPPASPIPIFALLEQRYGRIIESVRVELCSVALSHEMALALDAIPGEPALQLTRLFMDSTGRPVDIAINTHPAERYTYRIEIARDSSRIVL
jgi:GntR family transcriptional regulator